MANCNSGFKYLLKGWSWAARYTCVSVVEEGREVCVLLQSIEVRAQEVDGYLESISTDCAASSGEGEGVG